MSKTLHHLHPSKDHTRMIQHKCISASPLPFSYNIGSATKRQAHAFLRHLELLLAEETLAPPLHELRHVREPFPPLPCCVRICTYTSYRPVQTGLETGLETAVNCVETFRRLDDRCLEIIPSRPVSTVCMYFTTASIPVSTRSVPGL